ncbi:hypothetical protein H6F43_17220 [Leptolyngbya sp. FACHB-36]|uniref:hypothetical protein n=1 Tax=Leptolyngbya sp. FACHB-36 TaxID=2692808 RepID=UPI00167FF513|nr:hypothetical protein [Leptolyngbya sp. FACHB-36]MBD2021924.1 hypothetical protein [Leptolyngbya sp. FACHB-36]
MTPDDISSTLADLFGESVTALAPTSWQVETSELRLLVLLSDDTSWMRILVPIAPAQDAQPFLAQLLEANFDDTQETRYALHQDVLWGVFQHSRSFLTREDFTNAVQRLRLLRQNGLDDSFSRLAEVQVRQIIRAAKQQGQTLESTLQTLDRFYEEGLLGDVDLSSEARQETLAAWRYQLERLWSSEV